MPQPSQRLVQIIQVLRNGRDGNSELNKDPRLRVQRAPPLRSCTA
jgi:hypothetical protein